MVECIKSIEIVRHASKLKQNHSKKIYNNREKNDQK